MHYQQVLNILQIFKKSLYVISVTFIGPQISFTEFAEIVFSFSLSLTLVTAVLRTNKQI